MGVWGHLGAPCGAQGQAGSLFERFWTDFGLISGSLFEAICEESDAMGGSGAHGDFEVVSRYAFYGFWITFGLHFGIDFVTLWGSADIVKTVLPPARESHFGGFEGRKHVFFDSTLLGALFEVCRRFWAPRGYPGGAFWHHWASILAS